MMIHDELKSLVDQHRNEIEKISDGDPESADVLKNACELLLAWNVACPTFEPGGVDAIVAFSCGLGVNDRPGRINTGLASFIRTLREQGCRAPILAQWEIAEALCEQGIPVQFRATRRNGYLSTSGVWEQFTECPELPKGGGVLLIAHPDHFLRCVRLIQKSQKGLKIVVPNREDVLQELRRNGCDKDGFDRDSVQDWTTSKPKFIRHEVSSRLFAFSKGEI